VAPFLGTACFATHVIVPEEGAIRVSRDVPFDSLAAVGCAVVTGVGAVLSAARVPAGSEIAVIGAGGVGLNVVQGAVIAGCSRIIAVDRQPAPLALATTLGATETVLPTGSAADAIRERTAGRGADYVFDTVGTPGTLQDALAGVRKGGTVVLTGLSRIDGAASVPMFPFVMQEKRWIGSVYGSGDPHHDIPKLLAWHEQGKLKLDEIATRRYALDRINDALKALAAGEGGRGIVRLPAES
jgi:Zn-dependent alcohol dehydrogenase